MDILQGTIGLCDSRSKLYNYLSDDIVNNPFGMQKINLEFSNDLFPGVSTLMPNLVYFYLIKALYDYYDANPVTGMPESDFINTCLEKITNRDEFRKSNKGFHGEIHSSVFGHYKEGLEFFGFIGDNKIDSCNNDLKRSVRYQAIHDWLGTPCDLEEIEENGVIDTINEDTIEELNELDIGLCPVQLTNEERQDFIKRLMIRMQDKGKTAYSTSADDRNSQLNERIRNNFFSVLTYIILNSYKDDNITFYEALFPNNELPLPNITGFSVEKESNKPLKYKNMCFEDLKKLYKLKKENGDPSVNILLCYENAVITSRLEYVMKLCYSTLLDGKAKPHDTDAINPHDTDAIKKYLSTYDEWGTVKENPKRHIAEINNTDTATGSFLADLSQLSSEISQELHQQNKDNTTIDSKIEELLNTVKKREIYVLKEASLLDADIITSKKPEIYLDSFRWEYRKDYEKQNYGKRQLNQKNPNVLCVSYYIYELFFEKPISPAGK